MEFGNKRVFLAPMAGIGDTVFRQLCRECGADVVVSEMVSSEGLYYGGRTSDLLHFEASERPIGIQLFGADPKKLAYAAQYVEEHVQPDFIDLNSGCPVPKVVKKNGGASLIKQPALLGDIVRHMVRAVKTPVSVKIRSGWLEHTWNDLEIAKIVEDSGAAALTVHPRSRSMGFSGHSYWERIAKVKQAISIPVIGNGDIESAKDALAMFEQTGCDSIMIGRAAYGNPWVFRQIRQAMDGDLVEPFSQKLKYHYASRHLTLYTEIHGEKKASKEMKKHLAWYVKGMPAAGGLRKDFFSSGSTKELQAILDRYFELSSNPLNDE
ncbi:MAG: tRNA dihydrouridine synthase DusB [Chitinivibrionales bacterium]